MVGLASNCNLPLGRFLGCYALGMQFWLDKPLSCFSLGGFDRVPPGLSPGPTGSVTGSVTGNVRVHPGPSWSGPLPPWSSHLLAAPLPVPLPSCIRGTFLCSSSSYLLELAGGVSHQSPPGVATVVVSCQLPLQTCFLSIIPEVLGPPGPPIRSPLSGQS